MIIKNGSKIKRIYICHTYYNVFVSLLKEFNYQRIDQNKGSIALSMMSTKFNDLAARLKCLNIFNEVLELNEVHPTKFKQKFKYSINQSRWWNPYQWVINNVLYWRYIAKQTGKNINIDFNKYAKIFVYCDSDPIGQYLNYRRINYIAVEDGLEAVRINAVEKSVMFLIPKIILSKLGISYMQNGYSRYAREIEVNSSNGIFSFGRKIVEVSRKELFNKLTQSEKELIYDTFILGNITDRFENGKKNALLLAGQLCNPKDSIKIYRDIINEYCYGFNVYIKPHPIDDNDYATEFPDCVVLERFFPLEIFNIKCSLNIERMISVTSVLDDYSFAKEKFRLGLKFLAKYDYPGMLTQPTDYFAIK
ncbi:MAG: hypothetical protein CVU13_10095 [Bacteroidetes bacterium HGW-Bacteroidetes-8]|nr:MAG: hypothetical protein CVU13_10095 [Bacteroidetes bacterium HGW-Bacteroidetes-8]